MGRSPWRWRRRAARSAHHGGALCAACARPGDAALPVGLGTLRTLAQSLRLELAQLPRLGLSGAALDEARALMTRFLRFHVGLELRSEPVLQALLATQRRAGAA